MATEGERTGLGLSRWVGLGLLLVSLLVQVALEGGLNPPWRRLWFDTLQQVHPRERPADPPAVVIAIGESSLRTFGQWPWPRDLMAELVLRLQNAGVRAVGVDILFNEPDRLSPARMADWFGAADPDLAERIAAFGDTDQRLAEAMAQSNVVLPIAGLKGEVPEPNRTEINPAVTLDNVAPGELISIPASLRSLPVLQRAAAGQASIYFDNLPDNIVRAVPAVKVIDGAPALLLGPESLRAAEEAFFATVTPARMGLEVDLETLSFPTERNGLFWIHFGRTGGLEDGASDPRYIPAASVLNGDIDPRRLSGKIALLAVTGLGTVDSQTTSLAEEVWGIEAHLQMIEQILAQDFLRRPSEIFLIETAVLGLVGLLLIQLIPRAPPVSSLAVTGATVVAVAGISYVAFRSGWLVDGSGPALGITITAVGLIGASLIERDRERQIQERERAALLAAAKSMQQSVLPEESFEVAGRVRLAAHLTPAFDVGGDLYDHFLLEDGLLFFLVGDVSGKGVAA
ncbi:MAG: CHASE2 domain-containing protein, partial [Pseudomonadota bacterium]